MCITRSHLRCSAGSLLYFSTYEYLKVKFTPQGEERPSALGTLAAGGVAGIMNWVAALPIDVLKTRLQVAPEGLYSCPRSLQIGN